MLIRPLFRRAVLVLAGLASTLWFAGCAVPVAPSAPAASAITTSASTSTQAPKPVAKPASQPAPAHVPAPRTGPGGSTYGARHGGLVLDDQGVRIELDAQPNRLTLYLTESEQALSTRGATAHITLLNGVDIADAYLEPSADQDRLTVTGSYRLVRGTLVIVRVSLPDGRRLNARFLIII